ncbi:MAG: DUF2357 domain-containing protein [Candidatus Methanoperedens sp.]|nr:DUF2357 domain-containing protein [Candidatus Methanoperedens sp.]
MDTPTSTSDCTLIIESSKSGIQRVYKNQLECSKIWHVKGTFAEAEKIYFTYRLDEGEKYCNLRIPKCKDRITREDSGDARTLKFCWIPINFAGIFKVVFEIKTNDNDKEYTLCLDVLSKFAEGSNDRNFLFMLNSIREKHLEIYRPFNPSMVTKDGIGKLPPTPQEQFKVLEENMKNLENIVYQISLNPNKKLIKETRREKFYALDTVDHNVIYDIATQRGGLIRAPDDSIAPKLQDLLVDTNGTRYLPDSVIIYRTAPTFNVYENQLLKRFLTLITICSKIVERRFKQEDRGKLEKNEIEEIDKRIQKCKEFHRKAQYMKRYSFLDGVQETDNIAYHTPVLQREVNYMRFHDIFKKFVRSPFFDFSDVLNLPILDIPKLYEYWVVIQIVDILCDMKDNWNVSQHIIEKNEFGYLFSLREGDNSLFELSNNEKRLSLFYQKWYKTYAGRSVKPDITLEMRLNGKLSRILVLDPKYRYYLDSGNPNDPESAINKMHVYKEAIRGDSGDHIVEAAYAIYLGATDEHPKYDTKDKIGGMKLFPNEKDTICYEELKKVIQNFINS